MRNVLVFPDQTEQDFMYPMDRDVGVGTDLKVEMMDNSIRVFIVERIKREDKRISYFLTYK